MSDLGSLGSLHARIQEFSSGGWGGRPGQSDKKSSDNVFFFFFFFSPQLILQKSNGQLQSNLSFFKVPEGVQHFSGGGGGGSNCFFPIETHITCDFPGGPGLSPPPGSALALVCFLWNNAPPDPGYGVIGQVKTPTPRPPPPPPPPPPTLG